MFYRYRERLRCPRLDPTCHGAYGMVLLHTVDVSAMSY